jgi:hypothetical protein
MLHAQRTKSFLSGLMQLAMPRMEEAIGKFLDGPEGQERSGFEELHQFLAKLPVPATKQCSSMTHSEAINGQFLPDMDEEQRKRFTPTQLILYKHYQDFRYIV